MTTTRRRGAPLRADEPDPVVDIADRPVVAEPEATSTHESGIGHGVSSRTRTDEDRRSFADAVAALRTGGGSLNLSERTLMVVGGVIAPLGLLFVLLGWVGASRTPNLFEQVPYLISGGLFGLALVFLGSFFYFAHWITELVKESRSQSAALLEAIERLHHDINESTPTTVVAAVAPDTANGSHGHDLVATARGSMVHRPDCVVVAGKHGIVPVDDTTSMAACKLCDPHSD